MENKELTNKELTKFVENPQYRQKVINRIHKEANAAYDKEIERIEKEETRLVKARSSEIARLVTARQELLAGGKLVVNRTEGKIRFNNREALFSSIRGAELVKVDGVRVVTIEKGKRGPSLGGAVAGGLVGGGVGAVIGGATLGKKRTTSTSDQIPTCLHLGVNINIDGFVSEVVLIDRQVDQASAQFSKAYQDAQNMVSLLGMLANTPVPRTYLKVEEEPSVKQLDEEIAVKREELQGAKQSKPVYALPAVYRTEEQKELSDEDYLAELEKKDKERFTAEELEKQKAAAEKLARKAEKRRAREDVVREDPKKKRQKKIASSKAYKITFWILSVLLLLTGLTFLTMPGATATVIIYVITAVLVNPLITKLISDKWLAYPWWVPIIILVLGFFVGAAVLPYTETDNGNGGSQSESQSVVPSDSSVSENTGGEGSTDGSVNSGTDSSADTTWVSGFDTDANPGVAPAV